MISTDRVRAHTPAKLNARIDRKIAARADRLSDGSPADLTERIDRLEREWDIERWLETNASVLALTGLVLGIMRSRAWLAVPGVVLYFLAQHAIQGWCPPVSVFRRLGIRTRQEIEREHYTLKALRGDFHGIMNADRAIRAVRI